MATPINKNRLKDGAQCRALPLFKIQEKPEKRIDTNYYVEGHATTWEPYLIFEDEDGPVYEQFDRHCFDNADLTDVIMQFDHAGHVFARTGNGTLIVEPDDMGLFTAGDLGRTERARQMYDEIQSKMITKMSWRFLLGDYEYDPLTRLILHKTVKKVYDVSAVSIPANDNTAINARSWVDGVINLRARRDAELIDTKLRLKTKIKTGGFINAQKT